MIDLLITIHKKIFHIEKIIFHRLISCNKYYTKINKYP